MCGWYSAILDMKRVIRLAVMKKACTVTIFRVYIFLNLVSHRESFWVHNVLKNVYKFQLTRFSILLRSNSMESNTFCHMSSTLRQRERSICPNLRACHYFRAPFSSYSLYSTCPGLLGGHYSRAPLTGFLSLLVCPILWGRHCSPGSLVALFVSCLSDP